jgi:hypothetical protein
MAASPEDSPAAYQALIEAEAAPHHFRELAAEIRASLVPERAAGERSVRQVRVLQGIDRSVANRRFMLQLVAEAPGPEVRRVGATFLGHVPQPKDDGFRPIRSSQPRLRRAKDGEPRVVAPPRVPPPAEEPEDRSDDVKAGELYVLALKESDPHVVGALAEAWATYPRAEIPARFWVTLASGGARDAHRLLAARALALHGSQSPGDTTILVGISRDPDRGRVAVLARVWAAIALARAPESGTLAAEALVDMIRSDAFAEVREAAIETLGARLSRSSEGDDDIRRAAADAAALDPVAENRELAKKLFGR